MRSSIPRKSKTSPPTGAQIVERSPEELKPWPGNPRTHCPKQLNTLAASMQRFGVTAPVLIDENGFILSGHGRVQAAKALGLATIPTRTIYGLTPAEKRAYVIADNQIAQLSAWDQGLLKSELTFLAEDEFDIELTGFSTAQIDLILDDENAEQIDPDDLCPEDIPIDVVSRKGDLWQLGRHLLFCGDALSPGGYARLMHDAQAQIVVTDAPYNVKINGNVCGKGKVKHKEFAMAAGEMSPAQFTTFLNTAFSLAHQHSQDGALRFYFMDWRHMGEIQEAARPLFGPLL